MLVMRRFCFRILRLRNLLAITFLLILLYIIKTNTEVRTIADVAKPVQQTLQKFLQRENDKGYFVPTSLKV